MIRIPENGQFSQPNKGDISGNLNRTQNIDLKTAPGKMKVSARLAAVIKDNDSGITGMGVPNAFAVHTKSSTKQYYAMCGIGSGATTGSGKILVTANNSPTSTWANDTTTNTPILVHADYSDMISWSTGNYNAGDLGPSLLVSTYGVSSQIMRLYNNTTNWTNNWFTSTVSGSFTVSGGIKNMCEAFNGNVYITDDDRIIYVPYAPSTTPVNAVLTGTGTIDFRARYRPVWIRTASDRLWVSLVSYDSTSSGVGVEGYMGMWDTTGTAMQKIFKIGSPMAMSGCVLNDIPYIIDAYGVLRAFNGGGFPEIARLPVANQNIEMPGIYNQNTNSRWISHRAMDVVDGKININVNNFVSTGVYVEDMPSGVWEYDPQNPQKGLYHKNSPCSASSDWGQQALLTTGAIFGTKRSTNNYLAGFSYYTDDTSTSRNGIFYDDVSTNTNKRGSFRTPFVNSPNIQENWQKGVYRFKPIPSGDKIIGKYRTAKAMNLPFIASVTWTGTTSFTSTSSSFQYASVGDEIEIIMGTGASTSAHITAIAGPTASTYTITLDEAIGPASGSGKVHVENFRKFLTITSQGVSEVDKTLPNPVNIRVQIKTDFRVTGDFEMDDISIINSKNR